MRSTKRKSGQRTGKEERQFSEFLEGCICHYDASALNVNHAQYRCRCGKTAPSRRYDEIATHKYKHLLSQCEAQCRGTQEADGDQKQRPTTAGTHQDVRQRRRHSSPRVRVSLQHSTLPAKRTRRQPKRTAVVEAPPFGQQQLGHL